MRLQKGLSQDHRVTAKDKQVITSVIFLPCLLVGALVFQQGLHKNYWTDFPETWTASKNLFLTFFNTVLFLLLLFFFNFSLIPLNNAWILSGENNQAYWGGWYLMSLCNLTQIQIKLQIERFTECRSGYQWKACNKAQVIIQNRWVDVLLPQFK